MHKKGWASYETGVPETEKKKRGEKHSSVRAARGAVVHAARREKLRRAHCEGGGNEKDVDVNRKGGSETGSDRKRSQRLGGRFTLGGGGGGKKKQSFFGKKGDRIPTKTAWLGEGGGITQKKKKIVRTEQEGKLMYGRAKGERRIPKQTRSRNWGGKGGGEKSGVRPKVQTGGGGNKTPGKISSSKKHPVKGLKKKTRRLSKARSVNLRGEGERRGGNKKNQRGQKKKKNKKLQDTFLKKKKSRGDRRESQAYRR